MHIAHSRFPTMPSGFLTCSVHNSLTQYWLLSRSYVTLLTCPAHRNTKLFHSADYSIIVGRAESEQTVQDSEIDQVFTGRPAGVYYIR